MVIKNYNICIYNDDFIMRNLNLEENLLNLNFAGTRRRDCGRMTVA